MFLEGEVMLDERTGHVVKADVGTRPLRRVTLTWSSGELIYSCTCPAYTEALECCEHVLATLYEVERFETALQVLPLRGLIRLAPREETPRGSEFGAEAPAPSQPPLAIDPVWVLDREATLGAGDLAIRLYWTPRVEGEGSTIYPYPLGGDPRLYIADPQLDEVHEWLITLLLRRGEANRSRSGEVAWAVSPDDADSILPHLLRSGRLHYRERCDADLVPLVADEGAPWELRLAVTETEDGASRIVSGEFVRGEQEIPAGEPSLVLAAGWMVVDQRMARFEGREAFPWVRAVRRSGGFRVPLEKASELLERLWRLPPEVRIEWPESLALRKERGDPRPVLRVTDGGSHPLLASRLRARLWLVYERRIIEYRRHGSELADVPGRRLIERDVARELDLRKRLLQADLSPPTLELVRSGEIDPTDLLLEPEALPHVVRELCRHGWHVEAAGRLHRPWSRFQVHVSSGADWFDLEVDAALGAQTVPFPSLLRALRAGDEYITLDDGTVGILPETWLEQYRCLLAAGRVVDGRLRFRKTQVVYLERIIHGMPGATWDDRFGRARSALAEIDAIEACEPRGEFRGDLRRYQKEGLGWLGFLVRAELGGCLADDMGLGKTVQVLSLLESRRSQRSDGSVLPSLAVMPRSLVFNWIEEARKFTPELRVLDHTGSARVKKRKHLETFDLVITTYGTLVRDADFLARCRFEHVILDEAHTIKNPKSTYAKASRRLRASYRLALTGTPVENHLGELWSLFEFLAPGLLGNATAFRRLVTAQGEDEVTAHIARALRPLILRRTKQQVASDLPERVEQVIHCDLEPAERESYDELRAYYRQELLAAAGKPESRMVIIAGLLRLRQAACHPGLVDPARIGEPSGKLTVLLEQLSEIREEGSKALVFSQFTSFLAIVCKELERRGIPHVELHGKTRDRRRRVERFQSDPDCTVFLISLKAGGVGLNLTAAEYVFLLDPWWNPAAESQAIDRAHRIGQTRTVFAYRLLARDTIEERILELQERKRRLADAILGGRQGGLGDLKREDLERLLS